jgi:large subunit ribosomal protein L9
MEIILQQDFISLGYVGDRVNVKPGYARNHLIPRGIAVEVSSANASALRHRLAAINAKRLKLKAEAEVYSKRLAEHILEFTLKFGAGGKSFGSITARDVEQALAERQITLDRRQIRLPEPIKTAGEHKVDIKLHSEVTTQITVRVIADRPKVQESEKKAKAEGAEGEAKVNGEAPAEGETGKPKRGRSKKAAAEAAPEKLDA